MSKGEDEKDEVGYRRPPRAHRFKKGGPSPNPGGRPKQTARERQKAALDAALSAKVTITVDGAKRPTTKLEAIVQVMINQTLTSKPSARAHRLLQKISRLRQEFDVPASDAPQCGVLVVEKYRNEEDWFAWASQMRGPLDPLEGLPGIDAAAMTRAVEEKNRLAETGYDDSDDELENGEAPI